MFCRECGKKVEDGSKYCVSCGTKILPIGYIEKNNEEKEENLEQSKEIKQVENDTKKNKIEIDNKKDKPSFWYNLLGFFMPITAVLLFLLKGEEYTKKAKSCLKWAIGGCVTKFVLVICTIAFYIAMFTTLFVSAYNYDDYYRYNNNTKYNKYEYNEKNSLEDLLQMF